VSTAFWRHLVADEKRAPMHRMQPLTSDAMVDLIVAPPGGAKLRAGDVALLAQCQAGGRGIRPENLNNVLVPRALLSFAGTDAENLNNVRLLRGLLRFAGVLALVTHARHRARLAAAAPARFAVLTQTGTNL
jgi:hypothetical protein